MSYSSENFIIIHDKKQVNFSPHYAGRQNSPVIGMEGGRSSLINK